MRTSVIIPTFNAGPHLTGLLARLAAQKPAPPDEIVIIDSGSGDDTRKTAASAGARVLQWSHEFDHGATRDAAIAAASGEIVLLTVQDALPASDDWLARMTSHFSDPEVGGVTSRQIPPSDGPLELQIRAQLDEAESQRTQRISLADHSGYPSYSPAQRLELYRFDNVSAALRRSVWEKIPFGACRYAEDFQWARRALEAGHAIVRDNAAPVIHAHRRSFSYEFRRALLDAWVLDEAFGYRYSFSEKLNRIKLLRQTGSGGAHAGRGVVSKLGAVKTYSAHVLGRGIYGVYRGVMKPIGMGTRTLQAMTSGI